MSNALVHKITSPVTNESIDVSINIDLIFVHQSPSTGTLLTPPTTVNIVRKFAGLTLSLSAATPPPSPAAEVVLPCPGKVRSSGEALLQMSLSLVS